MLLGLVELLSMNLDATVDARTHEPHFGGVACMNLG